MEVNIYDFSYQVLMILTGASVGYMFEKVRKAEEKRDKLEAIVSIKQEAVEDGVRMILKIELRRIYMHAVETGHISCEEETFAEEIFAKYDALGGNGQGTTMIEALRKMLEIKK